MKIKFSKYPIVAIATMIFFVSCNKDDGDGALRYRDGVIVINEGNFTEGDASLSFINPSNGKIFNGIFSLANDEKALGDVANDAMISDGQIFVIVNNSNKMEVVNSTTMETVYTLENLALPRNVITDGSIGYLTEWVSFSDPGRVTFFDLENGTISGSAEVGFGAEDMAIANGFLYVSNQFSSSVSVIDLSDNSSVTTISVGSNPDDMIVDADGKIWLICGGGFDFESPFAALNNGQLIRIDPTTNTVETTIELNTNVTGRLASNETVDQIYFMIGNDVYSMSTSATSLPSSPFVSVTDAIGLYGLGVDPENGDVYALDAKGFQANGDVYRYSLSAELQEIYAVGRGPNKILFN